MIDPLRQAMNLEDDGKYLPASEIYTALADKGNPDALFNLARMHLNSHHVDAAAILFERHRKQFGEDPQTLRALAFARLDQGRTVEAVELLRQIVDLDPTEQSRQEHCFYSLHLNGDQSELHEQWARMYQVTKENQLEWDGKRALRIGYICPEAETVYPFLLPVLANHSERVETFCYSDSTNSEIEGLANHFVDCRKLSDGELAVRIRQDAIDVLVSLKPIRMGVVASWPAPYQASWIGYPHPLGVKHPREAPRVTLLEGLWAYRPDTEAPDLQPRAPGPIRYGSFNRPCKITPTVAKAWAEVMSRTHDSRLMVLAKGGDAANTSVRQLLTSNGVPDDRVELVPYGNNATYLSNLGKIDIHLDTHPYSGTNVTCDVLFAGVPVVTLEGNTPASRVGASLLAACGLEHLVAATTEDYVDIACDLAAYGHRLAELRRTMREKMTPLLDGKRVANLLERELRGLRASLPYQLPKPIAPQRRAKRSTKFKELITSKERLSDCAGCKRAH